MLRFLFEASRVLEKSLSSTLFISTAGGARDLWSKSTALRFLKLYWNRSYLDTRRALLRTRPFDGSDALKRRAVEHCSWTKLVNWLRRSNRSCFEQSRNGRLSGWEAIRLFLWTSV